MPAAEFNLAKTHTYLSPAINLAKTFSRSTTAFDKWC